MTSRFATRSQWGLKYTYAHNKAKLFVSQKSWSLETLNGSLGSMKIQALLVKNEIKMKFDWSNHVEKKKSQDCRKFIILV